MPSHLFVIFDHSGSMANHFSLSATPSSPRGPIATHATKIEEAKAQLLSWLETSAFDAVTIVPFSTTAGAPITARIPGDLPKLRLALRAIKADGHTNLSMALGLALAAGKAMPAAAV